MFPKVEAIIGLGIMLSFVSAKDKFSDMVNKINHSKPDFGQLVGQLKKEMNGLSAQIQTLEKICYKQKLAVQALENKIERQNTDIEMMKQEVAELKHASRTSSEYLGTTMNSTSGWKDYSLKQPSKTRQVQLGVNRYSKFGFSAYLDHRVSSLGIGQTIIFNQVLFNDGGAYNSFSGIYTCPENGVYLFFFAVGSGFKHQIIARLVVNGVNQVGAIADSEYHDYHEGHASNLVIQRMAAGTHVWVENYRWKGRHNAEGSTNEHLTTFSGLLLYK